MATLTTHWDCGCTTTSQPFNITADTDIARSGPCLSCAAEHARQAEANSAPSPAVATHHWNRQRCECASGRYGGVCTCC